MNFNPGETREYAHGTGSCTIEHAVAAWTSLLKGSDLPDASSVTTRTDVLAPLELWGARDTQCTMGGCWVSNNMPRDPGRVPAVLNI